MSYWFLFQEAYTAPSWILSFLIQAGTSLLCPPEQFHQEDGPVSPLHIPQICIDLLAVDPGCHLGIYTLLLIITTLTYMHHRIGTVFVSVLRI